MKKTETKIDPDYALWFFETMLWIDSLTDEELGGVVTRILPAWAQRD